MAEVAYTPDPRSPWVPPTVYYGDLNAHGTGDPNWQVTGWPGSTYLDTATGDRYTKESGEGTTDGWTLDASGGGGSGPDVKFGAATDPKGSVSGSVDDFYKSSEALGGDGSLWVKRTGAGTNTGWE